MTPADIERMAREAGIQAVENVLFRRGRDQAMTEPEKAQWAAVEHFAALVQAAERERSAKLCDDSAEGGGLRTTVARCRSLAAAIRGG